MKLSLYEFYKFFNTSYSLFYIFAFNTFTEFHESGDIFLYQTLENYGNLKKIVFNLKNENRRKLRELEFTHSKYLTVIYFFLRRHVKVHPVFLNLKLQRTSCPKILINYVSDGRAEHKVHISSIYSCCIKLEKFMFVSNMLLEEVAEVC